MRIVYVLMEFFPSFPPSLSPYSGLVVGESEHNVSHSDGVVIRTPHIEYNNSNNNTILVRFCVRRQKNGENRKVSRFWSFGGWRKTEGTRTKPCFALPPLQNAWKSCTHKHTALTHTENLKMISEKWLGAGIASDKTLE